MIQMVLPNKRSFDGETSDVNLNDTCSDDEEEEIYQKGERDDDWTEITAKPKIGCQQNFTDCSNVFKAFIGSAMVGLPFAVLQAGVGLSIIGILLIAFATDHCCTLIVKCKQLVISKMINEKQAQGVDKTLLKQEEELLGRTLSFGRIGKACLGRPGLLAVNISVMVTQFGFTIGYFIFLGNTMRTILKHFLVHPMVNLTNSSTVTPNATLSATVATTTIVKTTNMLTTANLSYSVLNTTVYNALTGGMKEVTNTSLLHFINHHLLKEPLSPHNLVSNSSTTFGLLLLIPLPLLVAISFIRNLRKLGPVSVIANVSITGAFAATAIFILSTLHNVQAVAYFRPKTFAVFFGQVTGAFEGIGTVIPIEGSMAENRPRYPCFLHISLVLLSFILGTFGIIGYVAYGDKTCQIVTQNLSGWIAILLQLMLFTGVLFTYPLQIYPCIQITERIFLKVRQWRLMQQKKYQILKGQTNGDDARECLIENDEKPFELPVKLKTWEGNLIRAGLVISTACIALFFRSQFAYIAALTGSVGSSLLSYILPAVFHISLQKHKMKRWVYVKNIFLIIFGVIGGGTGLVITLREIIESLDKGHPVHC